MKIIRENLARTFELKTFGTEQEVKKPGTNNTIIISSGLTMSTIL